MGRRTPADALMGRFIAALLSGIAGALGIGGGGILIIYLAMAANLGQLESQGINLLFFLPCGAVALVIHTLRRRVEWKTALICMAGGIPGAIAGVLMAGYIGSEWLGKIFAVLLILLGIKSIFTKSEPDSDN